MKETEETEEYQEKAEWQPPTCWEQEVEETEGVGAGGADGFS